MSAKKPKTKKKIAKKIKATIKPNKPIGIVTHYFGGIKVAIVKFKQNIKIGTEIHFKGATTDFKTKIASMQIDHKDVKVAKKGKQVGIKIKKKVREGDEVFIV